MADILERAAEGTKRKRKMTIKQQKEAEKLAKEQALVKEAEMIQAFIDNNDAKRREVHFPILKDRTIVHSQYGEGKVVEQQGATLSIQYEKGIKKQKLPQVLLNNFTDGVTEEEIEDCRKISELDYIIQSLLKKQANVRRQIDELNKI